MPISERVRIIGRRWAENSGRGEGCIVGGLELYKGLTQLIRASRYPKGIAPRGNL